MKNWAFALIELLVLIEIPAVLAGILLPTLSKAKSAAHRIACVNNQRQIRIARHLYAADHKGFQVPGWQLNNVNPPLVSGHVLWTAVFLGFVFGSQHKDFWRSSRTSGFSCAFGIPQSHPFSWGFGYQLNGTGIGRNRLHGLAVLYDYLSQPQFVSRGIPRTIRIWFRLRR